MKVDEARVVTSLNGLVTSAIFRAEAEHGEAARPFYETVARYEAALAALTAVSSLEGCIARRGVVTALLSAGRPAAAARAARYYASEAGAPQGLLEQLETLDIEACKSVGSAAPEVMLRLSRKIGSGEEA